MAIQRRRGVARIRFGALRSGRLHSRIRSVSERVARGRLTPNMAKRVYCTYFDHNYLSRGLALYHSLQRHAPGARLWVLCLSEACHQTLAALDLPDIIPVRLADF